MIHHTKVAVWRKIKLCFNGKYSRICKLLSRYKERIEQEKNTVFSYCLQEKPTAACRTLERESCSGCSGGRKGKPCRETSTAVIELLASFRFIDLLYAPKGESDERTKNDSHYYFCLFVLSPAYLAKRAIILLEHNRQCMFSPP